MGAKKNPYYRIIVADSKSPRDGRFIEEIGTYDPLASPSLVKVDIERANYWIKSGAQPTDTVRALLKKAGAGVKEVKVKTVSKKAKEAPKATAKPKAEVKAEPKVEVKEEPKVEVKEEVVEEVVEPEAAEPEVKEEPKEESKEEPIAQPKAEVAEAKPKAKPKALAQPKAEAKEEPTDE